MSAILEKNSRDPLYGYSVASFLATLKEKLHNRVQAAYLFGSFNTNEFHADSDIDLIIVKYTDLHFLERATEFFDLLDIVPTMYILVYTPDEFKRLTSEPSPGFWQSVVATIQPLITPAD